VRLAWIKLKASREGNTLEKVWLALAYVSEADEFVGATSGGDRAELLSAG
jgi:hypothetical protein